MMIPAIVSVITMDVPPKLIKGSGMPVVGIRLTVTLILISDWKLSQTVIPEINNFEKSSFCLTAMTKHFE